MSAKLAIVFLLVASAFSRLLLDNRGNLELVPIHAGANFTLPQVTYLRDDTAGELINLLQLVRSLQASITLLQTQIQGLQVSHPPACDWEGIRCHCMFKSSPSLDDVLILIGSNCTNGRVGATKALDAIVATTAAGCSLFNTTDRCTDMVL